MTGGSLPDERRQGGQPLGGGSVPSCRWVLLRETSKVPELGLEMTLTKIRDIDVDEYQRIDEAAALFSRFTTDWPHSTAVRHAEAFFDSVKSMEASAKRAVGQISLADIRRVRATLEAFAKCVASWVTDAAGGPLSEPADMASDAEPVKVCKQIAGDNSYSIALEHRATGAIAVGLKGVLPDSSDRTVYASRLVSESLLACGPIGDAELEAAEPGLLAAGSLLMGILAEVVWGRPVLNPANIDADGEQMQLELRSIGLHMIEPVLTACAVARKRRDRTAAVKVPDDFEPSRMVSTATVATPSSDEQSHERVDVEFDNETAGVTEAGVIAGSSKESDGATSIIDGSFSHPRPADPRAVLNEATSFGAESERRWSDALGPAVSTDIAGIRARVGSLMNALYAEMAAAEVAGLSTPLPGLPLDLAAANHLEADPRGQDLVTQHGIALVYAVSELGSALAALEQPTAVSLKLPEGTVTSWWSQQGFTRVHDAARMAWRVVVGPEADAERRRGQMATLAAEAWTAGLPEAALMYVIGAVDPDTETAGPLSGAYQTLKRAAERLASGQHVSLDAVVPIAQFWLGKLLHPDPPQGVVRPPAGSSQDA